MGPLTWSKLSHKAGHDSLGELIATYELKPSLTAPDLRGKSHFFWTSGSGFDRARELFPEQINKGFHAAGPGSTLRHIRKLSGLQHPVKVFAGLEQFWAETLPPSGSGSGK